MAGVAGEVELDALEGFYKKIYADKLERAVPIDTWLQNRIKFREDESDGEDFNQPVSLKLAHGVSYARTNVGAFALNAPQAIQTRNAKVTGSQMLLRHSMSYETAAKASKSDRAFGKYVGVHMLDMRESATKRLEISLFYGQIGLGTVASISTDTLTITTAEWSPAVWSGMDGAPIQIYSSNSAGATLRANPTSITTVDLDNKTVTVNSGGGTGVVAGDVIFFGVDGTSEQFDGTNHNDMVGLHKIASHSSGTLFNINSSNHSLWKPNTQSAGSTDLSFGTIQKARAKSMARGDSGDCVCLCAPITWANLMTDQAALRRYGVERKTMENGAEALRFYSQSGSIDIIGTTYVKEGYAYVIQPKKFKRLGATDITFDLAKMGLPGGQIFRHMENNAGIEFRAYSHQALFTSKPGCVTLINNIVNS